MRIKVLKQADKTRKPQNFCPWYQVDEAEPVKK
jgi:hypothetical protein